jgi:hypothetical protein
MVFFAALLLFLASCGQPPSYPNFTNCDQKYYEQVADACDLLLQTNQSNAGKQHRMTGDDPQLPPVLKDLHATEIDVDSNVEVVGISNRVSSVSIEIDMARMGWGINWGPAEIGDPNSAWELSAGNEGSIKVLYSRAKTGVRGTVPNAK